MAKKLVEKRKAPGVDMLAFSAIMTIMLAFFIMLTSFIKDQEAELLMRASASFRKAVSGYGLNSFIERISKKNFVKLDINKSEQTFSSKPVENIYLKNESKDNNLLEEDIDFDDVPSKSESYIPTLIGFEFGDYHLNDEAKVKLDEFINLIVDRPSRIIVEGRVGKTEIINDDGYEDWYLSSLRAHSVSEYLRIKGSIDMKRLSIIGYGKHRPLVENEQSNGLGSFVGLIILNE